MTSSNHNNHLGLDLLEDRLVPDASALDPDFFNQLNFQAYDLANQQTQDRVRVYSGLYQQGQAAVQEAEAELQNQQNQTISNAQAQLLEIQKGFESVNKQLEDYKNALQNRYKDDVSNLGNQAQQAINQVMQSGMDPTSAAAQTNVILAWTRAQYENLTKGVDFQMQEVLTAYNWLQQAQKDQFAGVVNAAIAQYNQLQAVQQQLLNAYDTYNIALLDQFQAELNRIQAELVQRLTDIQNAWINYTQLVTQQQLYQSYDYSNYSSGYSGGSSDSGHIYYDDNAPKGGY